MKKFLSLCVFSVVMMLVFTASAQTISWEIVDHGDDIKTLEAAVTEYANNGYVPMGMTHDKQSLYVLYVEDPDFGMEAWLLEWYADRDAIQQGINKNMKQGYIPTGITYTGDLLYVLYVKTESSANAWQLIPSANNLQAVEREIQPYISQGYLPMDIASLSNEYWTMLLQIPDTTAESWLIETYNVGSHGKNIDANIEKGYIPWGLNLRGNLIDILYIGF